VRFLRYVAVDDCGRIISPLLVEGQVHGGIAQGIGQALYEEVVYDEGGQLLTATLMDYAVPRAEMLPRYELDHTVTPSPLNPMGAKGVGEAGTIGSTPLVVISTCRGNPTKSGARSEMPKQQAGRKRCSQHNLTTIGPDRSRTR
jgi:CO/xanthine dehydrogenase Mo-binding subunit